MAKRPATGRTKTRLCPPLTGEQAAELYRCLLLDTLESVRTAVTLADLTPFIAYAPAAAEAFFRALAPDFGLLAQGAGPLGQRLAAVLGAAGALGYGQAAAINSDSPALPPAFLAQAFRALDDSAVDVALGPCDDGGYYLIGWKRPFLPLVRDVRMSTPHVLADTLALADAAGLRVALLPPWYDIDEAADLARMTAQAHAGAHTSAFLER
jgi:rSAM/selenodomain-associated transferase 1